MDTFLSGNWKHYVVVDRPHFQMFRHLQGPRRSVLVTEDVLPEPTRLLFHVPFIGGRSITWSRSAGISFGWHLQQMVKIGIASLLQEDGLAYCDSDTFFLRPFDVKELTRDNTFRLLRAEPAAKAEDTPNPTFTKTCISMLGLPADGLYNGYVDNFVTWHRQSVVQLQDYLANRFGGKWRRAFRNRLNVSEYNLYGLYVDHLSPERDVHFHTGEPLCKTYWKTETLSEAQVQQLCQSLAPNEVMVGVQSFAGVDVAFLNAQFEAAVKNGTAA